MLYIISVTNNKSCGQITLKYEAFAMFQFVLKNTSHDQYPQ